MGSIYSDVDVVRSERLLREDEKLQRRVVNAVKELHFDSRKRVEQIRDFYHSYLDHRLGSEPNVDFSTLALAGARNNLFHGFAAFDALKTDFIYQKQEGRSKVLGWIAGLPKLESRVFGYDEKRAVRHANNELNSHLSLWNHKEHLEMFRKTDYQEHKDWFAEMSCRALEINAAKSESPSDKKPVDKFTADFYKWLDG